jgi:chromosome segregation ATPase
MRVLDGDKMKLVLRIEALEAELAAVRGELAAANQHVKVVRLACELKQAELDVANADRERLRAAETNLSVICQGRYAEMAAVRAERDRLLRVMDGISKQLEYPQGVAELWECVAAPYRAALAKFEEQP